MGQLFNYSSIFAPYFQGFIKMKQDLGYQSLQTKWIFLEFDKFFNDERVKDLYITRELIDQWRSTRLNDGEQTLYTKYTVWSQFSRYMCTIGQECYIPRPPKQTGKNKFVPYIFSHKEIKKIFRTCDSLRLYDNHSSTILFIMPAIIRLLYGTGIRVSEALSLKNEDVDLKNNCITLKRTKNKEQRLVPLSDSLRSVLEEYLEMRNKMPLLKVCDPEAYFFVSPSGQFCRSGPVYCWFRKILSKCEIQHIGNHHGPRVHDLRHTFAIHSMINMVKSGYDLYYSLPILSTYLGHKSIKGTEQYVRLTAEMYPELLNDERQLCAYVFPKINITKQL